MPYTTKGPKDFLQEVRTAAWITSGARYNAARRLTRREFFGMFSIAMFSVCAVGLALVQRVYSVQAGSALDNFLTTATIFLGIFIVVISLIDWGAKNSVKAELLYINAEELNTFQRKVAQELAFVADGNVDKEVVNGFREQYEKIKNRCPHNHEPLDADAFRAEQRSSPDFQKSGGDPAMSWLGAQIVFIRHFLHPFRYFIALWLFIVVMLYLTPWPKVHESSSEPSRPTAPAR